MPTCGPKYLVRWVYKYRVYYCCLSIFSEYSDKNNHEFIWCVLNLLCINKLISIQMSEFWGLDIFLSIRIIFKLVDCTISITISFSLKDISLLILFKGIPLK